MRELNWMTVILLVVMAIAFISTIAWIVVTVLRKSQKNGMDSKHDS
ncbi:hypothetical protein V3C33_08410 [Micrococcaceae bacterium Sec5.7]